MRQDFETGLISLGLSRKLEATSTAVAFGVHSPAARALWLAQTARSGFSASSVEPAGAASH